MKILYLTAKTPWGKEESFILDEMIELTKQKINLLIIPRNPCKKIFHKDLKNLLELSIWLPLINTKILIIFIKEFLTNPICKKILKEIIKESRNTYTIIKNLIIFPKSIFIAKNFCKNISHIHAHWGSTTSTMAYIISKVTNIPWSFTLHRWDIKENNLLKEKIKTAKFVRCISEHGKKELIEIIENKYLDKIKVIHMGVSIPQIKNNIKDKNFFFIAVPAHLIKVKGHKYLIEAYSQLVKRGIKNFKSIFYGNGKLKKSLNKLIKEKGLEEYIKIHETIPHKKLLEKYKNKKIDLVILPSINTKNGEHEGIPVSLMEAMTHKIAVISTNTGGIPELLSGNCGIIVKEKSSKNLADAIEKLMGDKNFKQNIIENGYEKIKNNFNIIKNVESLIELIKKGDLRKI